MGPRGSRGIVRDREGRGSGLANYSRTLPTQIKLGKEAILMFRILYGGGSKFAQFGRQCYFSGLTVDFCAAVSLRVYFFGLRIVFVDRIRIRPKSADCDP